MLSGLDFVLAGSAAVAAGAINALAGGGTLITFPTLLALGVPPITANVTNTVALCPGFMGGILAQLKDLTGQRRRFWIFLGASAIGGVIGSTLLLCTGEQAFMALVPFLILTASCLLAVQGVIRIWKNGPRAASSTAKGAARGEPQAQMISPSPFSRTGHSRRSGAGRPELRIISKTFCL